jgi:putrescine transport system substrate-binding protein
MIRKLSVALCLGVACAVSASAQERVVNVYNWSDYVDPSVLEEFTSETGIKVVYDTYDNNEIIETKLLAGKSGYDIVVPSGPFVQRMIAAGVLHKLDKSKLANIDNVYPEIKQGLAVYDPGNDYVVNYMWGTTGLGLNIPKIKAVLGESAPLDSFDLLMKPEYSGKLKECGIQVLDSPEDFLPGIMNYLGLKTIAPSEADLNKTGEALQKIRANIQKFHSSEFINALANGEICLAVAYSGDILQGRSRAIEAQNGVEVTYVIPKEGAQMWFDSFAIVGDAEHKEEAYQFIDYMLRPEVAAKNSNFVSYASGVAKARELTTPEISNDKGIYPPPEVMARLFTTEAYDAKTQRLVTRLWTRLKSGR